MRVVENPTHLGRAFLALEDGLEASCVVVHRRSEDHTGRDNHLSNSRCTLFTRAFVQRERESRSRDRRARRSPTQCRVLPINRVDDALRVNGGREARTRAVWPSTGCTYVNRRWISDWKKPLENPLSAVSPWSSWGKQIWRCYHWSCDGSTSLLPYRTRKSILLLPTNTRWGGFSSKRALSLASRQRGNATIFSGTSNRGCARVYRTTSSIV